MIMETGIAAQLGIEVIKGGGLITAIYLFLKHGSIGKFVLRSFCKERHKLLNEEIVEHRENIKEMKEDISEIKITVAVIASRVNGD